MAAQRVVTRKNRMQRKRSTRTPALTVSGARARAKTHVRTARVLTLGAEELALPRGHVLFKAGDPPSSAYVVVSGCVKLVLPRRGSEPDKVVALLRPSQTFEASAVLLGDAHLVSAIVVTKARVVRIGREDLLRAMDSDPLLSHELTHALGHTVRELLGQLRGAAAGGTGAYRVVTFLLDQLADRPAAGEGKVKLSTSKRAVAARLQLSPEHLSRVLGRLVSLGLIAMDGPDIVVRDVAELRKHIGVTPGKGRSRPVKGRERRVSRSRTVLRRPRRP
jgi:CRP-like cAMP-binding protein